jgi:hypothetical protein
MGYTVRDQVAENAQKQTKTKQNTAGHNQPLFEVEERNAVREPLTHNTDPCKQTPVEFF